MMDVKLIAISHSFRVVTHVLFHIIMKVMRSTSFDACACGTDETSLKISVNYIHYSENPYTTLHSCDLYHAPFSALKNKLLPIFRDTEFSLRNFLFYVFKNFHLISEKETSFGAFLSLFAPKDLIECLFHVGVSHNLFDNKTFSYHKLSGSWSLPTFGPDFFESLPTYQTLPINLIFRLSGISRCWRGSPPSAQLRGHVPIAVRRLL